jgi:hypothetical protein
MLLRSYNKRGIRIERGGSGANEQQVRDLQRDLRQLGYLKKGIDGRFGGSAEMAVGALRMTLRPSEKMCPVIGLTRLVDTAEPGSILVAISQSY